METEIESRVKITFDEFMVRLSDNLNEHTYNAIRLGMSESAQATGREHHNLPRSAADIKRAHDVTRRFLAANAPALLETPMPEPPIEYLCVVCREIVISSQEMLLDPIGALRRYDTGDSLVKMSMLLAHLALAPKYVEEFNDRLQAKAS